LQAMQNGAFRLLWPSKIERGDSLQPVISREVREVRKVYAESSFAPFADFA